MSDYKGNEYKGYQIDRTLECDFCPTETGQSDSVRGILNRYAREGVTDTPSSKAGQFAAAFSDDEPLHGEVISTLMDQDDLTNLDEMELHDYIRENTDIIDPSKSTESIQDSEPVPPPDPSQVVDND